MARPSSVIEIHELPPTPQSKSPQRSPLPTTLLKPPTEVVDKTLASAANLVKLLPSGSVFAFQALSPSFTNKGTCYPSNKYLTSALILICSLSCLFFSITDTVKGTDGKLYYGIATFSGLRVVNFDGDDDQKEVVFREGELRKFRLRGLDYVHAVFSLVLFLAVTFGDSDVRSCLFPNAGRNTRELLVNLPLGAAVMSSLVFMTFPTSRKGIGYSDATPHQQVA